MAQCKGWGKNCSIHPDSFDMLQENVYTDVYTQIQQMSPLAGDAPTGPGIPLHSSPRVNNE